MIPFKEMPYFGKLDSLPLSALSAIFLVITSGSSAYEVESGADFDDAYNLVVFIGGP